MARPIDEKLVVMKLDNSDFKKKASDTVSIFGKLKSSLNKIPGVNLGKTVSDMGALSNATKGINLNPLSSGLSAVRTSWSAMGIVGASVLNNLTNHAMQAGSSMVKSLTMDQVSAGFNEYELKIGAINTMLSNTEWEGGNLESINAVLADLNDYADQTVYNFGHMTENIGRFTAAGVGMEDSAIAIKGLSNLAAASGSDVNQLNSAMYQMSQTMSSGVFNLMDWNSLVNSGMGGKKTQDALLKTAEAMGVNVDMSEGFRNSISDGWLSAEIFLETMKQFGEDESMIEAATAVRTFTQLMDTLQESIGSGWATTFEHIFGDFEEATDLFTSMADSLTGFFQKSTDARNKLVEGIAEGGGFENIFEGLQNAAKPVIQIFGALKEAFQRVFPPKSVDQIVTLTEKFLAFTKSLTIGEGAMGKLTTIFEGAFSVFSSVIEIAKGLGRTFLELIPAGTGTAIMDFLVKIANLAIEFNTALKEGEGFQKFLDGLKRGIQTLGEGIKSAVEWLGNFGRTVRESVGTAIDWIIEKIKPVGDFFKDAFKDFGGDDALGLATIIAGLVAFFKMTDKSESLFDKIGDLVEGFAESMGGVVDDVKETFGVLQDTLQSFATGIKIANLVLIAGAVTLLAVSLKVMEDIEMEDITKGIIALAISLGVMMGAMVVIQKFNVVGGIQAAATILALSAAVTIIAGALDKLSDIDPEAMSTGLKGLVVTVASLAGAVILMSSFGGKMDVSSLQLLALAAAVVILAEAVETMSAIETGSLFKSIGALALILGSLAAFLKVVDGAKFGMGSALGVVAVSAAILIMVGGIERISAIDTNSLIKGLITMGVILAEIAIFSKVAGGPQMLAASVGIALIAGAMVLLMGPIQTLSGMSWSELVKGLGGMAVALVAVAAAGLLASGAIAGAAAIAVIAVAMNLLVPPIQALSQLTWNELIKGIVGMGLGLATLAAVSMLLTPAVPSMLGFGLALLALGAAVLVAGVGVAAFGMGLTALATMSVVSVAAIVSALGLLLTGLATLIPAAVNFIVELGVALIGGIVTLIPAVVEGIAQLITALLTTISEYLPQIIEKGVEIVIQLVDGLIQALPQVLDAVARLAIAIIDGLSNTIREYGPTLVATVLELVGSIVLLIVEAGVMTIDALFGWIPGVSDAMSGISETANTVIQENFTASDIAAQKGQEFADSLGAKSGEANIAGTSLATGAESGANTTNLNPIGSTAGFDFAGAIQGTSGNANSAGITIANSAEGGASTANFNPIGSGHGAGFASGIASTVGNANSAGITIANSAEGGASTANFNPIGSGAGMDFSGGLSGTSGAANSAGNTIANSGKNGAGSVSMNGTGSSFGQGFANGISSAMGSVVSAAKNLASAASNTVKSWLDINSPSRLMEKDGKWFDEGFAKGIRDNTDTVEDAAGGVASGAREAVNGFLSSFDDLPEGNELHFKAVIDSSEVDELVNGSNKLMGPNTSYTRNLVASTVPANRQNDNNLPINNVDDEKTQLILSSIDDKISRIDPDKPVYLIVNDKVVGQSVTKQVIDNYDTTYMKAERGLANA